MLIFYISKDDERVLLSDEERRKMSVEQSAFLRRHEKEFNMNK